jgi:hypothetical protein
VVLFADYSPSITSKEGWTEIQAFTSQRRIVRAIEISWIFDVKVCWRLAIEMVGQQIWWHATYEAGGYVPAPK